MHDLEIDGLRLSRIGPGTSHVATPEWTGGEGCAWVTPPARIRRTGELAPDEVEGRIAARSLAGPAGRG